jgi:hypothetical protein
MGEESDQRSAISDHEANLGLDCGSLTPRGYFQILSLRTKCEMPLRSPEIASSFLGMLEDLAVDFLVFFFAHTF